MDRESKKLVCPECGSEDYIVFSEQVIEKRISIPWVIITVLSFIIFIFLGIGSFFAPEGLINKPTDFSNLRIVFFWLVCIIAPLTLTIIGVGIQTVLYYMPKIETLYTCKNCNNSNNICNLTELVIHKNNQEGE